MPGRPGQQLPDQEAEGDRAGRRPDAAGGRAAVEGHHQADREWITRGALTTAEECPPADSSTKRPRGRKSCNDRPVRTGDVRLDSRAGTAAAVLGRRRRHPDLHPAASTSRPAPSGRSATPSRAWTGRASRPSWDIRRERCPSSRRRPTACTRAATTCCSTRTSARTRSAWADGYFPCFAGQCDSTTRTTARTRRQRLDASPIGGTQVAGTRYEVKYPEGVGIPVLSPDTVLIANLHYTNPFQPPQPIYGESWLNMYFYKPGEFKVILDGIFAINFGDLFVEPYQTRTISRIWKPRDSSPASARRRRRSSSSSATCTSAAPSSRSTTCAAGTARPPARSAAATRTAPARLADHLPVGQMCVRGPAPRTRPSTTRRPGIRPR